MISWGVKAGHPETWDLHKDVSSTASCISEDILIWADPLQVPVSGPCMYLKPLVVFIHDNLFLYTRHITHVCFPSIQRDSCHHGDGITTVAELQYVCLVDILQLKYELMDAALFTLRQIFLLFQRFIFADSYYFYFIYLFVSSVCFTDGTQTHSCNRLLGSRTKG